MTRTALATEEGDQLDAVLRLLGLKTEGEPVKRESPDFLVTLEDGRTIGLEVVRALDEYIAGGRGARSRIKREVLARLKTAWIDAWVNVRLREQTAGVLNRDAKALGREIDAIVALARKTVSTASESRWYYFEWIDHEFEEAMSHRRHGRNGAEDLTGTGIEYADTVMIYPGKKPMVTWRTFSDGQRAYIVQDAIDDKSAKLPTYRSIGAREIWLLVVGSSGTGGALFVSDVEDVPFESPFDKTVFLEQFEGKCAVLKTTPPAALSVITDPATT
jgi:hypothetical protein